MHERSLSNVFVLNAVANSGLLLTQDTTVTTPLGVGQCPYGNVTGGSISVAGDREFGVLYYPTSSGGVSLLEQLAMVLDYSVISNSPVSIWHFTGGEIFETDSFAATGTGAITAGQSSGNSALGSQLGIISGKYVLVQGSGAGSVPRARLIGNGFNNGIQCIRVLVY